MESGAFSPSKKYPQYIAALAASLAALSTGAVLGWTAQISQQLLDGELGFKITEDQLGWIGSLLSLGAATLTLFTGSLCGYLGTKRAMLLMIVVITVGWAQIIWASSVGMLYLGRFMTGMVAGAFCVAVPLYTNEIAEKEIRGALGCFTQLNISFGILFTAVAGKFLTIRNNAIVCAVLPLAFGCVFVFMPESPVHLVKRDRSEEASNALRWLRGKRYNVELEMKAIESSLQETESGGFRAFKESFGRTSIRRASFIGVALMVFKAFCGVDAITSYFSLTLETAEMDIDVQYGTIIFMFVQSISAVLQIFVVDRLGRRILLLFSEIVMTICLYAVAAIFFMKTHNIAADYAFINYIPLVAFCVFTVGFSMGIGPIPYMMCAELFPGDVRNFMSSFCNFVVWILIFAVVKLFMVMATSLGAESAFFMFGVLCTLGACFVYVFVPETKGLSLDQIQKKLGDKKV